MPVMIARGDGPGHGMSAVGEDAGVAGVKHGPVRDDREPERRRRFSGARTAAAGLRSLHAGSGRVFAAVTLMPALLAVAWLVPGAGLLLAGRLLPMPMVIVFGTLAVALCYFAMRRLPARWPRFSGAAARSAGRRAVADDGDRGRVRAVAGVVPVRAGLRGQRSRRLPAVRVLDRHARDGADSGVGRLLRRGPGAGLRDPRGSPCPGVRSPRRSCRGCRWCSRAGRGWAGSAGRC